MLIDALELSLDYLVTIIPFMIAGVILAELLVELGWIEKIGFLVLPMTRYGHLRKECSVTFLTAFASSAAANSALKHLYDEKVIDEKELIISSVLNSFPSIIMHWRTMLPVLVPLLGVTGLIYLGLLTLVGLIKTLIVLIAGHLMLDKKHDYDEVEKKDTKGLGDAFKASLFKSKKTLRRILLVMIPTTVFVFILMDMGVFDAIAEYLKTISNLLPVPANGLPIIAAQFASKIATYTIAGNLLSTGVLSSRDILVTMLVGKILTSVTSLRILAPYYIGIFGPRLGMKTMLISTLLRVFVLILITAVMIAFF